MLLLGLVAALHLHIAELRRADFAYVSPPSALEQQQLTTFRAAPEIAAPAPMLPFQPRALIVPVTGVETSELEDTWGAARSEGRRHEGIDIMAPAGTFVRAAADGRITRFFNSRRGGITIYQYDKTERFLYYYAHLQGRAAALREGDYVRQGQVIGFVGQTGNATTPHLHFEIQRVGAEHKWWKSEALNPYPYLRAGQPPRF